MDNNIGDDTDIFTILSQMQLEIRKNDLHTASNCLSYPPSSSVTDNNLLVEYTTQDVLDLFST